MQRHLKAEWEARNASLPYRTPYEALIMASIIEKETGLAAERDMIAGVLVNRLRIGMRLQADPTVIYGIRNFSGNLTRADLNRRTPFNTYTSRGLPPRPSGSTTSTSSGISRRKRLTTTRPSTRRSCISA